MPVRASAGSPTSIRPDELYSLPGFITASGISYTRIRTAARDGIDIPTFTVGQRKFIKGDAAIQYVEKLAAQKKPKTHFIIAPKELKERN